MTSSLFGSSGIRQIADRKLLELAQKVGMCLGAEYRSVIIGRDTRTSGEAIKKALEAGLMFSGSEVSDAGTVPTPTLAYAGRRFTLGIMVTASHNPPQYNGIKIFNPDGSAFDAVQRQNLEATLSKNDFCSVGWQKMGKGLNYPGAVEEHKKAILSHLKLGAGLKIVLDCGCGAASVISPGLFKKAGCEVIELNCSASGFFPRPSEPSPENIGQLAERVISSGADLGLAHDGDADRVVAVDHRGRFVSGDALLIILARQINAGKLVVNIDCSMAVDDQGFKITRTRVGDSFISDELKNGGDFGGEPSGAYIFPSFSLCPDGIYGAAMVVQAASRKPLAQWVDEIPEYYILRGVVEATFESMPRIEVKLKSLQPLSTDKTDGIRLNFTDGWLLVRPSGTEPKIRITAESKTRQRAEELLQQGFQAVKES